MGCCGNQRTAGASDATGVADAAELRIAIAGNPNCGKSALFNVFTGIRQQTGNWPGVTVDRKEGRCEIDSHPVKLIDLPGIYSFDASSLDEQVAMDYLLSRDAHLVINVIDAANLERNLYLSVQLLEMGVPMVVALNMMDVAEKRGLTIDVAALQARLACPVVAVVAVANKGIAELQASILAVAKAEVAGGGRLPQQPLVTTAVAAMSELMTTTPQQNRYWQALRLLESDSSDEMTPQLRAVRDQYRHEIEQHSGEDISIHLSDTRFSHAHDLALQVQQSRGRLGRSLSDEIDRWVLGRWTGVPLFLLVMYLMFMFTINIGGAFIDFFDMATTALLVDGLGGWISRIGLPDWLRVVLADGVGGGIAVVATFIPVIAALYLFLSTLEDWGYMARAAFVMDRFMRAIGLPGKAFVPLIVGFGCNVPAVMATRTLESVRERKLTILMNPFMSCGARLPVYVLFAAAFFPENGQNLVFLLYLAGISIAILTGLIMKRTLLRGESAGFMMELPAYHLPTISGVLLRSWDRVRLFIKEAGQVIVVMVLALTLLNSINEDGSFGNKDPEHSVLGAVSKQITPLFAPMGIHQENWPAVVSVFSGVLAKEVVVGTLDNLYSGLARVGVDTAAEDAAFDLATALREAFASIPQNLAAVGEMLTDPLGIRVGDLQDVASVAAVQSVSHDVFGAMASRFDGQVGAFAYLLFILMYFPCVATIGVIRREAGGAWAVFVAFWTTLVAYISASVYYQAATYAAHPGTSISWISGLLLLLTVVILVLRFWARNEAPLRYSAEAG